MTFDKYVITLKTEDFTELLSIEGEIFGETKYNLSQNELVENLQKHQDRFINAQGCCLCLNQDLGLFDSDVMIKISELMENVDTYFIKENPELNTDEGLYSYSIIFAGL